MSERNQLVNGRFLHDLNGWTISGATYSAGDGDEHYGVSVLSTGGDYVEQAFAVEAVRVYTMHLAIKPTGGVPTGNQVQAIITDGNGNQVVAQDVEPLTADDWNKEVFTFGLASGTTYTLRIINNSFGADVKIDDVWLWHVPLSRFELAETINRKLGRLAANRNLSTMPNGNLTEGDYTDAVSAGLRSVGAINAETGLPDVRYLDEESVQTALDLAEREALEMLQRDYAVEVDTRAGPQSRDLSQISKGIEAVIGVSRGVGGAAGGAGGRVITRDLKHPRKDFDYGE